jgi:hypothetical protein
LVADGVPIAFFTAVYEIFREKPMRLTFADLVLSFTPLFGADSTVGAGYLNVPAALANTDLAN